jgi:hypothetical protein
MDKQLQGTAVDLNLNSPLNVEHDGSTGRMEKELMGSEAPTSNTPIGLQEFDKGTLNGEFQLTGEQAPLSYKPMHGWQSDHAPNSERAIQQSK